VPHFGRDVPWHYDFRFRNRIGIDFAVEALKLFHSSEKAAMRDLLEYARLFCVERVMMPYIETLQ